MTIASLINRADYIGNGATDTYSYGFKIFVASDLLVTQRDTAGNETTFVLNTDYTVTGVGDTLGGTIVLTAGNLTTDYALTIRRVRPLTQPTDIRNNGDYFPETHEDAFDHVIMIAQHLNNLIGRQLSLGETDSSIIDMSMGAMGASDDVTDMIFGTDGTGKAVLLDPTTIAASATLSQWSLDTFSGDGATKIFTLTTAPPSVNVAHVSIDGVYQHKATYTLVNTTLTFTTAPVSGTNNIEVTYGTSLDIGTPGDGTVTATKMNFGDNAAMRTGMDVYSKAEIQAGGAVYAAIAGTDTYAMTLSPAITAYAAGMVLVGKATNANTSTTPTLNVNALGVKTIKNVGGGALIAADMPAGGVCVFIYDGTDMILQNPNVIPTHTHASGTTGGLLGAATFTQIAITDATVSGSAASPPDANTITKEAIVKAWVTFDGTAAHPITPDASFNIDGTITKTGTGDYTISFDRDFADVNYAAYGTAIQTYVGLQGAASKLVGSCRIETRDGSANAVQDSAVVTVSFVGNQ